MEMQMDEIEKYTATFLPNFYRESERLRRNGTRFAHYTSAATALSIIDKATVWLRSTSVMNDFSEVHHGHDCIVNALNNVSIRARMITALNQVSRGLFDEVEKDFLEGEPDRLRNSYMIAVSEHEGINNREDLYGRLSMWRAYGGKTNVAFVFNSTPFLNTSDALNAYTSPVLYADREIFERYFIEVLTGLESDIPYLRSLGKEAVRLSLKAALHFGALSTKHPGFAEEREWRVIYMKGFSLSGKVTNRIQDNIETVEGIPQRVAKVKLENYPDEGHVGATLPELLHEIIVGPTQYPWPIYDALVDRLMVAGVPNADQKVRVSNIPLRR
jgi:hypothetical protein